MQKWGPVIKLSGIYDVVVPLVQYQIIKRGPKINVVPVGYANPNPSVSKTNEAIGSCCTAELCDVLKGRYNGNIKRVKIKTVKYFFITLN